MIKTIRRLEYIDNCGNPNSAVLGNDDVKEIKEHRAQGEGDKWFYDVCYSNGKVSRFFSFTRVDFEERNEF